MSCVLIIHAFICSVAERTQSDKSECVVGLLPIKGVLQTLLYALLALEKCKRNVRGISLQVFTKHSTPIFCRLLNARLRKEVTNH